jgi:hypothetical protein
MVMGDVSVIHFLTSREAILGKLSP